MSVINEYPEFEKTGSSSKWDHHISLALVFTIVSVLCLNPFALACGIASIYFAVVVISTKLTSLYILLYILFTCRLALHPEMMNMKQNWKMKESLLHLLSFALLP